LHKDEAGLNQPVTNIHSCYDKKADAVAPLVGFKALLTSWCH
jgi:hypothetical protein